jgi:hypothetical protein
MLVKCYIWNIALYCAETWTLQKANQKYLQSFEMWCLVRMGNISEADRVNSITRSQMGKEYRTYE